MIKKTCPFTGIECGEELCALWIEEKVACTFVSITMILNEIAYNTETK